MGLSDLLKKIFPPGKNPLLGLEPQCVRYDCLTLRVPTGWRFTEGDGWAFKASGPGDCRAELFLANVVSGWHPNASEFEANRKRLVSLIAKHILRSENATETMLPTGVMWMEAMDAGREKQLRVALLNTRPRYSDLLPPMLQVTCTMPAGGTESFTAETFHALRNALRNIEWN
jgi:hypothetical protein